MYSEGYSDENPLGIRWVSNPSTGIEPGSIKKDGCRTHPLVSTPAHSNWFSGTDPKCRFCSR